jgi:hypothetical protein
MEEEEPRARLVIKSTGNSVWLSRNGRRIMRRERRKNRFLRRLVLGLAVAAIVAPAAQAHHDSGTVAQGNTGEATAVIHGDDKVIVSKADDTATNPLQNTWAGYPWALQDAGFKGLIHGDDKVIVPRPDGSTGLIHGDDKVIAPRPDGFAGLIHGDDKVIAPRPDGFAGLIHGDDKVITPKPVQYTVAGLPPGLQDDGNRVETPVEAVRSPGSFDWSDALVGAGVAFGLMLLLGGATLATRHVRPTAA